MSADPLEFPPVPGTPDAESYARFIEEMTKHCHCRDRDRPCDGVLAGGICDNIQDEEPRPEEEFDVDGSPYP